MNLIARATFLFVVWAVERNQVEDEWRTRPGHSWLTGLGLRTFVRRNKIGKKLMQTKGNDKPKVPQSLKLFLVKSVALIKSAQFSDNNNLIQQFLTSNWSHNSYFLRLPVSNLTESPKRPCVRFACSVSPAYKYPDVWVRHCGTEDYSISVKKLRTPLYSHNEDHNYPAIIRQKCIGR